MMKSFFVIAIFALVGFCLSSAASIDVDDNEIPESMEAYKSTLESMFRQVSKQIRENSAFDENMVLDNFEQENMFDDEQSVTFTEEEEEGGQKEEDANDKISPVEDDHSTENVGSGISCRWRGREGKCCQSLRIIRFRVRLCLGITIQPPASMRVALTLNGRTIWRKTIGVHNRSFNICLHKGPVKICIKLYNLHISSHYAKICIGVEAKAGWIHLRKRLGCIAKRFALHEIPTIKNKPNTFSDHKKHNDELPSHGYEQNNVVKFEMA